MQMNMFHSPDCIFIKYILTGTWNCGLYEQLPFIHRLKLYALFVNGKTWDCPVDTVICYIEVAFKADLTVYVIDVLFVCYIL